MVIIHDEQLATMTAKIVETLYDAKI